MSASSEPVPHNRLLLDQVGGGYARLTVGGLFDWEVSDDHGEEMFPDRFSRSGNIASPRT